MRDTAKLEIEHFELAPGEKIITYFSEFPSIAGFPYKIVFIQNPEGTLFSRFRQWDTEYDFTRWDKGIYNLDRLRILTEEKVLAGPDLENLKKNLLDLQTISLPQTLQNEKAIVLDGSDWAFGICFGTIEVNYQWKAAKEAIEIFVPIIELMQKQHFS